MARQDEHSRRCFCRSVNTQEHSATALYVNRDRDFDFMCGHWFQVTQLCTAVLLVLIATATLAEDNSSDSGTPVCGACLCSVQGPIELINCSSRGFQNTFPGLQRWPEEARYGHANDTPEVDVQVSVSLERNKIRRVDQFPLLLGVLRLSLARNSILDIASHAFLMLDRLMYLDLSYNQLKGESIRADVLRGSYRNEQYEPMALISLNLAYNDIHSVGKNAFEHLPHLQELRLSGNPLKVLDIPTTTALGSPDGLKVLELSATKLSALSDEFVHLASLRGHLEVLVLSENNFTEVPGELAALGSTLRRLNLNGNPLRELGQGSLLGLRRLTTLSVSGMPQLTRIGPGAFDELDNITVLYAAHNPYLSDIDVDAFRQLKGRWTLKELHAQHNALETLPEGMAPWSQLELLDLQSNPWRCDCELQWLTASLVPRVLAVDPEHGVQLHCQAPQWLAGTSLVALSRQPEGGRASLCSPAPPLSPSRRSRSPNARAALLMSISVAMCCIAAAVAAFTCYRRLRGARPVVLGEVLYVPVRDQGH